jgi:hypothetical protein
MLKIFSRHELQHGTAKTLNVSYRQADRTCATARPQLAEPDQRACPLFRRCLGDKRTSILPNLTTSNYARGASSA